MIVAANMSCHFCEPGQLWQSGIELPRNRSGSAVTFGPWPTADYVGDHIKDDRQLSTLRDPGLLKYRTRIVYQALYEHRIFN
jgi:hypothetical protein